MQLTILLIDFFFSQIELALRSRKTQIDLSQGGLAPPKETMHCGDSIFN